MPSIHVVVEAIDRVTNRHVLEMLLETCKYYRNLDSVDLSRTFIDMYVYYIARAF